MVQDYLYGEKDNNHFFVQDDVHFPHVLSPLFASFQLPAIENGTSIAFENMKFPLARFVSRLYRGRKYQHNAPYRGDLESRAEAHARFLETRMPRITEFFQEKLEGVLLPYYGKLKGLVDKPLSQAEAVHLLREMHDFYQTAWAIHFEAVAPRLDVGFKLESLFHELTGEPATDAYDLVLGIMNKSLETDRAFWQLANEIRRDEALRHAITGATQDVATVIQAHPEWAWAAQKMAKVLETYGYRSAITHEFNRETWVENPTYGWDLIKVYLQKDYDFDSEFASMVARREEALSRVLQGVPDGPAKDEFLRIHGYAMRCWALDEDHNFYIDNMLPAVYRPVLLNIGKVLVHLGVLEQPDQIFFLYYEEVCEALERPTNMTETIRARVEEYDAYWSDVQYQPHLGPVPEPTDVEDLLVDRVFGLPKFAQQSSATLIKGYAASRGVHTGVVKVVADQNDFRKVLHGDVLVCRTTTPPWTVLFTVAGAVVTDAGGILSHAGTVAREYRIPAVLGTKFATKTLKDGDVVRVDGSEGTIEVLRSVGANR